jgi:hypothetical protein
MGSPQDLQNDEGTHNDQTWEVQEELLCPLPHPSAHTITGGHLVTSVNIMLIGTLAFNGQRFHSTAAFISEVSSCRWGKKVGQYTDLPSVLPTYSPQSSFVPRMLLSLAFESSGPKLGGMNFLLWQTVPQ